jgi:hypothetical protein
MDLAETLELKGMEGSGIDIDDFVFHILMRRSR